MYERTEVVWEEGNSCSVNQAKAAVEELGSVGWRVVWTMHTRKNGVAKSTAVMTRNS